MDPFLQALPLVFNLEVLSTMAIAAIFGLVVGSVPGLTATMATALLVPLTFFMDPVPAIASMVTATAMAIFAGDIPGALLRVPGTPASAAYAHEAFAMTRKGLAERALGTSLVGSAIGGMFGTIVLVLSAPQLAEVALQFTQFEYFWLACLGLTCAVFVSTASPLKGAISLIIGLFIATVGIDITAGYPRYTLGIPDLLGGVAFIPAMIGMFAIAEILRNMVAGPSEAPPKLSRLMQLFSGLGGVFRRYWRGVVRGSVLGTAVGILPGAGGDIAAWVSYALSKKLSKEPEKFGTGHVEGIVDAGSANNAALSGAWVPALVFGIPGDSITAIVIGVLYVKGMNPGPTVFIHSPELIYGVFITFFLANIVLIPFGFAAIGLARHILRIPRGIIWPIVLLFSTVGAYAIDNSLFGVVIMLVMGILAFVMEENGFPVAPAILGLVLGPMLEGNFMTAMIKADGNLLAFFERPIAAVLGVITLAVWFLPLLLKLWRGRAAEPASPPV
ncbi:tripartite tricarboxylate transporter permease [Thalassobaculum sp. OXR-137]|uniref:tripartite tricarboxylate transporter permease n=1 Tax=Thalassobaculum sp. OXR-137 TaxID=3100173 RepID=UPI002AC92EFC|nr:tripartite tricarboxylate transporter permease [Thalassobaculum sp. OXR-137]WPZ36103.1 tripartite tricarboxylate transporter permease [Thalassobaculum sp. OXR-137]